MARRTEPINALGYAQFHLRGGWRNLLTWTAVGLLTAVVIAAGMMSQDPARVRQSARAVTLLLLTGQWLLLTIGGFFRVAAAIRADMTGGLIESHRLTPDPPLAAVLGYVVGGALQVLAVALATFVVGGVTTVLAGLPLSFWVVGNGMALAAAALLWAFAAAVNFGPTSAGLSPAVGLFGAMGSTLAGVVPAVTVLCAPVAGRHLWQPRPLTGLPEAFVFTLAADVLLTGVFLLAAARQYRSSVTEAFDVRLAMLLLAVWSAITVVGLAAADAFGVRVSAGDVEPGVRTAAAVLSCVLVAFVPAAAIARRWTTPPDMYAPGQAPRHPAAALWLLPLCVALVCAATLAGNDPRAADDLAWRRWTTVLIVAPMLVSVAALTAWQDLIGKPARAVSVVWLLVTNLGPVFVQVLVSVRHTAESTAPTDPVNVSPVAALFNVWSAHPADAAPGVFYQAVTVTVPLLLLAARRVRTRHGPALTTPPAAAE